MATIKKIYGADPEVFAVYERDGKAYCLPPVVFREDYGIRARIKRDPNHPVFLESPNWMMHEDGAAFEMSVTPTADPNELWETVNEAVTEFSKQILANFSTTTGQCGPRLMALPTVGWEISRWSGRDEEFHFCTRFGCDPDLDAFNTAVVCRTEDARDHPYRYGGGHFHFSGIPGVAEKPELLVYSLAFTAGLASVVFSDQHGLDRLRTYRYGKPGKHRVQRYGKKFNNLPDTEIGLEYRPLSNAWVANRELFNKLMYFANIGIDSLFLDNALSKFYYLRDDVEKAITQHDVALATDLLAIIERGI